DQPGQHGLAAHSHGAGAERVVPEASRAEWFTSFDVDAFEVPTGREEEWRFTPMKRLRGLHDGSAVATGRAEVEVDAPDAVRVETVERGDERLGVAGTPGNRVAAQAWCSFQGATLVTLPGDTRLEQPVVVTVTGPGADEVAYG